MQSEVVSLNQGDLSVTKYFTKLRIIWDKLDNFRPNPVCICQTKCTCFVASIISQRKCEDQVMQFLRGLNEQYHNIKSHVLLMEPIPPIPNIFSLVAQQERQLANNFSVTNINSVSSNRNNAFGVCVFVEKLATLRMCVSVKLVFLDKIIGLIKITEKCVLTVVEMVIRLTLVTKSMDTLLGTNSTMVKLVKLILLLLLMKLFLSILKRNRK